jgi:PAS domain S-box-containing protein
MQRSTARAKRAPTNENVRRIPVRGLVAGGYLVATRRFRPAFRVLRRGGELHWLTGAGAARRGPGPRFLLAVATGRRRSQASKRDQSRPGGSDALLREMADTLPQVMWSARADGVVDYANRAWHTLTGEAAAPVGDALWAPFICDDGRERYRRGWQEAVRSGQPFETECRLRFAHHDAPHWYLARAWPARDARGQVRRWYGTWTEIEAQKGAAQAEALRREELEHRLALRTAQLRQADANLRAEMERGRSARAAGRESNARFARVFRASPVPMALSSGAGEVIWDVNDSWQVLFGYRRADVIGKTECELNLLCQDASGDPAAGADQASGFAEHAARMRRRDGSLLEVAVAGARIGKGAQACFLTIVRDQTEQRRREQELRAQGDQLTYLARVVLLGELCGAIAHELNQPLAAILANAEAGRRCLARTPDGAQVLGGILDDIADADRRAAAVIRRLRALFLQGGTRLLPLDLAEVARESLALAGSSLAEHGVRVETSFEEGPGMVRGDPVQLQQVLLNLIVNACEAMSATPPGLRRLAIGVRAAAQRVQLTVVDSGPGLAPESLQRVFDSFFTSKPHGLGFGLSISRAIIVAHGGAIEGANAAGGGAMFRITLPLSAGGAS